MFTQLQLRITHISLPFSSSFLLFFLLLIIFVLLREILSSCTP